MDTSLVLFGHGDGGGGPTPEMLQRIERLGHVVLETNRFRAALDWYLETLGMIVSDFLFLDDMRDRGPGPGRGNEADPNHEPIQGAA